MAFNACMKLNEDFRRETIIHRKRRPHQTKQLNWKFETIFSHLFPFGNAPNKIKVFFECGLWHRNIWLIHLTFLVLALLLLLIQSNEFDGRHFMNAYATIIIFYLRYKNDSESARGHQKFLTLWSQNSFDCYC